MITEKELDTVELSPTKKDYYQIWNELLDLASKISDRWSPKATNESDPGIVLLKALTAIADKLNYNIDTTILEAFMPSASQEESMRKLTEMMGYTMKYYRGATTDITFKNADALSTSLTSIYFPKYINVKDTDEEVNYVTLEAFTLNSTNKTRTVAAIEGELVECETDNDNIISMTQLDSNNRYILPETNVAENGIFVINIDDDAESENWLQVDNLNTQLPKAMVYKFGFDSKEQLPYIQFPDDISQIIADGLRIRYIRTNGVNGNISAKKISKMEVPSLWSTADDTNITSLTTDNFTVTNNSATTNGADPESLDNAYNNYKKTVGTFDTLVTCRDYMNKIYQLTNSETDTTPLVSNAIVSDIRDDINRAATLCSFDEYGICYTDVSLKNADSSDQISHFDLVLYPFKTVYGLNTYSEYTKSFTYNAENASDIQTALANCKTIAHQFVYPSDSEIICIKNYLKLKAKITTTRKVTATEGSNVLANVYESIYKNFNARQIDFGEAIPYDTILSVIENADSKIKNVSLDEPTLYTKIVTRTGEYEVASTSGDTDANRLYNKLVLRNVLAGRIAAFSYDNSFDTAYDLASYTATYTPESGEAITYESTYPVGDKKITKLTSAFNVPETTTDTGIKLLDNEVVQFRMPNLRTTITYPAYVNYYLHLEQQSGTKAVPAVFVTVNSFLDITTFTGTKTVEGEEKTYEASGWQLVADYAYENRLTADFEALTGAPSTSDTTKYKMFFVRNDDGTFTPTPTTSWPEGKAYYYLSFSTYYGVYNSVIQNIFDGTINGYTFSVKSTYGKFVGLCKKKDADTTIASGYMVDDNNCKYIVEGTAPSSAAADPFSLKYVQQNLGSDAVYSGIGKNAEYTLGANDFLAINYTDSTTDSSGNDTETIVNKYYSKGTIINPNFALIDSSLYHSAHSYSKQDGFNFSSYNLASGTVEGMFTLGSDEQICIREVVQVVFDEPTYVYWNRLDDDEDDYSITFNFNEDYDDTTGKYLAYTLKDGEYFYYTDQNKTDLGYYGSGTTIRRTVDTPELIKYPKDGSVDYDDVVSNGLTGFIPWVYVNFSASTSNEDPGQTLTMIENQYISLTAGDTLYGISQKEIKPTNIEFKLTNEWVSVKGAWYQFSSSDDSEYLPEVTVDDANWMVRSRLDFNIGSDTPQVLHQYDSIGIYYSDHEETTPDKPDVELIPGTTGTGDTKKVVPMTLYANYTCQLASDTADVSVDEYTNALGQTVSNDFKLKLSEKTTVTDILDQTVNLRNYSGDYTKYTFSTLYNQKSKLKEEQYDPNWNSEDRKAVLSLNINIPTDEYGLIMFYYKDDNLGRETHKPAYLKVDNTTYKYVDTYYTEAEAEAWNTEHTTEIEAGTVEAKKAGDFKETVKQVDTENTAKIVKFNSEAGEAETYTFSETGMVVLKINKSCTLSIFGDADYLDTPAVKATETTEAVAATHTTYDTYALQGTILFSNLDIVAGINPKLDYRITDSATSGKTALDQMLEDIKNTYVADDFYYNVPIEGDNVIELNDYIADDTLSSPESWYDSNNICNKFVISEIDADYLTTGITLTKSSRS